MVGLRGLSHMNIGFLMGSFDPIHIGHLNMVRLALNSGMLDKVIIVPSGHNPWKKEEPAPASIEEFGDKCEVSPIESTFDPPYYSNKPLNYFRENYKDDKLFILCGTDTMYKIPNWKNAETDILPFYGLIEIAGRGCAEETLYEDSERVVIGKNGNKYPFQRVIGGSGMSASSTEVRNLIRKGLVVYPLINSKVEKIIKDNGLYPSK